MRVDEFIEQSQKSLEERERELTWLKFMFLKFAREATDRTSANFRGAYRSFISVTYAHFEGFTKFLIADSLNRIRNTSANILHCNMGIHEMLIASNLRKKLADVPNRNLVVVVARGKKIIQDLGFPDIDSIQAATNLTPLVFSNLLGKFGICDQPLKLYYPKLGDLVRQRNECAHGEEILSFSSTDIQTICDVSVELQNNAILLMHGLFFVMADFLEKDRFQVQEHVSEFGS